MGGVRRSVFIGTGAFLARIESETRCAFWADEPTEHGFDPARLITVDLARTPSAAAAGEIPWDAVEVDDCYSGTEGNLLGTTLGTRWPEFQLVGMVYLEESFWRWLPDGIRPPSPPTDLPAHAYELMTAVYWPGGDDPRAGNRYTGHHAEILTEQGKLAHVAVYPRGTSGSEHAKPERIWIDLSTPEQCDVGPRSLTTIGVGAGSKQGALYLLAGAIRAAK
jgi:hypothetical protein